jgi:diguanylate cyclase (GGDEF)-like protein
MSSLDGTPHRILRRQLRRARLSADTPPDAVGWAAFLEQVSGVYQDAEADRYTLERAIEVSSDEMRALYDALSSQARQDALTGLPNRSALTEFLRRVIERQRLLRRGLAVLFLDLDGFKLVNDSLGHRAGDELLVRTAERLRGAVRDTDMVARLGGDEFVIVLDNLDEPDQAVTAAQRVAEQLSRPFRLAGQDTVIGGSVGIAVSSDGHTTVDDLLRQADMAMYAAKASGRNRYVAFDDSMSRQAEGRLSVVNALRHALDSDELVLLYQPVVSLIDLRPISVEALVRWNRVPDGLVAPDSFIPIAEEAGLIASVDAWVISQACAEIDRIGAGTVDLAVNLSAQSLRHADIVNTVSSVLQRSGRSPSTLVLELTESAFALGSDMVVEGLNRLRALGVALAIDDFGTGYSSLSYLRKIPAQTLKIDRSFVSTLDQDRASVAIVGAIVQLGHAVGMQIIAEGVERPGQLECLRDLGCDAAQGFLLGTPQPIAVLADTLCAPTRSTG